MTTPLTTLGLAGLPDLPDAACRNTAEPDAFFPGDKSGRPRKYETETIDEALEVCTRCPARLRCLAWALEHKEVGIWGGTTDDQRRRMGDGPLSKDERRDRVAELHAEGMNDRTIAETLSVSRSVVEADRRAMGLPANYYSNPEYLADRRAKVAALHDAGLNDYEIAAVIGTSRDNVRRDRRLQDLPTRHRNGGDAA